MDKKVKDDKIVGWNNIVKECKRVQYNDKRFILVQTKDDYYMVDEEKLSQTVIKYLHAYIEDYSEDEFAGDVMGKSVDAMDQDPEIEKLKVLVSDLR